MKYGVEVEGMLSGIGTLFCQVEEIPRLLTDEIAAVVARELIAQIYVSDHDDVITEADVTAIKARYPHNSITIETLGVPKAKLGPQLVSYMINVPFAGTAQLSDMGSADQIKLTNGLHVMTVSGAFSLGSRKVRVVYTYPEDFAGDIEL